MQLLPGEEPDLYTLVNEGLALYHAGRAFEAHEIWEYAWNGEVGRTKLTLQAIIQIAAAVYKDQTENPRGAAKLFAKAKDKIAEVREGASAWLGIDLVRLAADVDRALEEADRIAERAATGDASSVAPNADRAPDDARWVAERTATGDASSVAPNADRAPDDARWIAERTAAGVQGSGVAAANAGPRGGSALGRGKIVPPFLPRVVGPDGILYLHGFASGPSSQKASLIVPRLVARGFHVAVPDLNEGDFEHLTMTRALALARRRVHERTLVIGSSLGGYLAALAAAKDERVKALVLMAPAFDMAERLRHRYGEDGIRAWQSAGTVDVEHYAWGGKHPIGYGFFEDAQRHQPHPLIRVPTYVLQGSRDDVVSPEVAKRIQERNPGLVELEITDDEHGLTGSTDLANRAIDRIIERLHLRPEPKPADADEILARRFGET